MSFVKLFGVTQEIIRRDQICQWVQQLGDPMTRSVALVELNKRREVIPDLGMILWNSFGTMAAFIQEIVNVFSDFNSLKLTIQQSHRVCNVLCLLKSVANHPETKTSFAKAQIPEYIYPLLKLLRGHQYENIRMASLKVLEALVKNGSEEAISFLLPTDIILHILEVIEKDSIHFKSIAFSILQAIMLYEGGLQRMCDSYERFFRVSYVFNKIVDELAKDVTIVTEPGKEVGVLLNHVVQCYWRLSENARAREALRRCLPIQFRDKTFALFMNEESSTKNALTQLLNNLEICFYM